MRGWLQAPTVHEIKKKKNYYQRKSYKKYDQSQRLLEISSLPPYPPPLNTLHKTLRRKDPGRTEQEHTPPAPFK